MIYEFMHNYQSYYLSLLNQRIQIKKKNDLTIALKCDIDEIIKFKFLKKRFQSIKFYQVSTI